LNPIGRWSVFDCSKGNNNGKNAIFEEIRM
jgi:hypothetical protein